MTLSQRVDGATRSLASARTARDFRALERVYGEGYALFSPRLALERANADERAALRRWFEACDDVLRAWLCAKDEPRGLWRRLLTPGPQGFGMPLLAMNAWWLREAGSDRLGAEPGLLADEMSGLGLDAQAKRLGRFVVASDAASPLDYGAVAGALEPALRPFFASWFLGVYLMSPFSNVATVVAEHRLGALSSFAEFHREHKVEVPPSPLMTAAGYRATYWGDQVTPFLETYSSGVLAPSFARLRDESTERQSPKAAGGTGVVLSCWWENHPVHRCIDPLLAPLRASGVQAYDLDGDRKQAGRALPKAWQLPGVSMQALPAAELPELARTAQRIAGDGLDLLFFPEVGLTLGSRWLSTQRLARVQAAGYGHPVTTGSSAIDYFIGGAAVETAASRYRERLILLPGLGVGSTAPPPPSFPRQRPVAPADRLLVNVSSFDKLNAQLLGAWDAVLAEAGQAVLQLLPAVSPARVPALGAELSVHLKSGKACLTAHVPRQACIDLLCEADLYLDSFPFGGFNTLIEALAAGCPVVTLEGKTACGRFGAAMLRILGLPEFLIARTPNEYVAAARRILTDDVLRADVRSMLGRERVLKLLCDSDVGEHFAAAVKWMLEQGPEHAGPPVLVAAGEAPRLVA